MVAVGAALASIGCYSVPQQSGSVASAAAVNSRGCQPSRVAGFVQGLFVSLSERCGLNRGAASTRCSLRHRLQLLAVSPPAVCHGSPRDILFRKTKPPKTFARGLRR